MTHPPFHPPSKIHPIDEDLNRTRSDQIDFGESILRASQRKDGIELKDRRKAEKDRRDKEAKEKRKIGIE